MQYSFSVFNYDAHQKKLYHGSEVVEMPKKCHELLLHLLANPEKLIEREDLIEHVWHGRVVTHNTIDQCILKLRKALNQYHEDDYIESVYGQGVRFLQAITVENTEAPNNHYKATATDKFWWRKIIITAVSLTVLLFIWLFNNQANQPSNKAIDTNLNTPEIDVQNTTAQPLKGNWQLEGAANYLPYLLSQYPDFKPRVLSKTHGETVGEAQFELDLSSQFSVQRVLLVKLKSPAKFNTEPATQTFEVALDLKEAGAVISSHLIQSDQLNQLYPAITRWVTAYHGIESVIDSQDPEVFSQKESALKNYFIAIHLQTKGDSGEALKYLQTATEQDPTFKMAWYEMAIALRKQSDARKAIGILSAINTTDPTFKYRITLTKAQCLDSIREFKAAAQDYAQALEIAEQLQDTTKMAAVYISQGILYRQTQQYELAQQALDQAELIVDANTQPHLYGSLMNTFARLARDSKQPLLAIEKTQLAIKAYQQAGDLRYLMISKGTLASILIRRNEFNQAEKLVKEALIHAEELNHQRGVSDNRTKLAKIYQQTGKFRLAQEQWQMVLDLNTALQLPGNKAEAYLWLIELHLAANNINQAEFNLNLMSQHAKEHSSDSPKQLFLEASLIYALHQKDLISSEQYLTEFNNNGYYLKPLYQGDLALLTQKQQIAEMHYLEALMEANSNGHFDQMTLILNRLNALYLTFNTEKLSENLSRTSQLKPFIYPLQKYQAQSAMLKGEYIKALSLMEELKLKAGDYWQTEDQLLLESMQLTAKQKLE